MKKIYISAGEASGDFLGANLAETLLAQDPTLQLVGMGGDKMRQAGVNIVFDAEKLSVMGFIEVLKKLPSILWTLHKIKSYFRKNKLDAIVCIDLPDTHFRFFKLAKKLGIPVFYYVSPQIWAWRYSRITQIKKYVQHMGVLFSFEEKIYRTENIPVTFIGHPLAQTAKITMPKNEAYDFFNLKSNEKIVALFPGSRHTELKNHFALMIESVEKIREKEPNTQFVLALAPHFNVNDMTLPLHIKIIQNNLYDLLSITDAAIAVSGTITLEIGLMGVPLCVIYRTSPLSAWIAKKLVKTPYIALCNIVSEKLIAQELIQEAATAEAISSEILALLHNENYHAKMQSDLLLIKDKIENKEGVKKFAAEIL
ncbi:MAG: lipid-A-disaccharide synthase [Coxiellaceae bacterium]|nr:lipid-A-disaccharide synthase [Coxiellaceae bacterium]